MIEMLAGKETAQREKKPNAQARKLRLRGSEKQEGGERKGAASK